MSALAGHLAAAQALVVALVFAWAGMWKVAFRQARTVAAQSALVRLLGGERQAVAAHLALGGAEIAVAILLLLLPPARALAQGCAALLALGFLGYLILAWRIAPEAPCACMGGRATRILWRSLARAGALLALSIAAWPAAEFWGTALAAAPWLVPLLALELAGLWLLSPELGGKPVHQPAGVPFAAPATRPRLRPRPAGYCRCGARAPGQRAIPRLAAGAQRAHRCLARGLLGLRRLWRALRAAGRDGHLRRPRAL